MALRNPVRRAVCILYAQSALHSLVPVALELRVRRLVRLQVLVHRYLPEYEVYAFLVQTRNHLFWLRPETFAAETIERRLVAPRLYDCNGHGKAMFLCLCHGVLKLFAAVPVVGRYPRPEDPLRRQHRFAREAHIRCDHFLRRAGEDM